MTHASDIIRDAIAEYQTIGTSAIEAIADRFSIRHQDIIDTMVDHNLTVTEKVNAMTEEEYDETIESCTQSILSLIQ